MKIRIKGYSYLKLRKSTVRMYNFPYCDKKITLLRSRCSLAHEEMNESVSPPIKPNPPVCKIIVHTIILSESWDRSTGIVSKCNTKDELIRAQ